MDLKVKNICKYILIALMAIGVIFGAVFFIKGEAFAGTYIVVGYIMIGLGVLALLAAPVLGMIEDPSTIKTFALYIALFAVIALIAWLISGNTFTAEQLAQKEITAGISHLVSAGVNLFYIVFGCAVGSILFAVIYNSIKK